VSPSLTMTRAEREAFLADVHVGVIAIEQGDGPPLAVPLWYDYAPADGLWFVTERDSLKGRLLRAAGRCALCAQSEEPSRYRYVNVEGPIVSVRAADPERDVRPMAHRYLGPATGDLYMDSQRDVGESLVFTLTPERWRTVDYGKLLARPAPS